LIQLSRITKVNLMRHAKRSTARDFKIMDTVKKARAVAHRTTGAAHPAVEPEEEAGDEAVEEAEGEGEEGDEEIREQAEEGEEEELVNQEGVDDEETEENVAEGLEAVEVGAGGEDDDVVAESDEEAVQAVVSSHVSEDRRSKGSAPRRRNRVVDSNDESDGEQPVSCQVSAKRQRSL
jgi:Fanconi anemia group I protein